MDEYTPEKVADLIAEALRPMTDLDVAQRPEVTRAFIRRLGVALEAEHKRVEELRALSRRWQEVTSAAEFTTAVEAEARAYHDNACIYERERDELRAVIAELSALHFEHENTIHTTPATVCAHRYCVDGMGDQMAWPCPTGRILSRITDKEQNDD